MKLIKTLTWSAVIAAAVSFGATAYAQQPSEQGKTPDQSVQGGKEAESPSINGELTRVMPDQKAFTVKSTSGAEMLFRYNDQTVVTGAENNVAGLATSSGSVVTVSYRNDSAGNLATRIEVHPKR